MIMIYRFASVHGGSNSEPDNLNIYFKELSRTTSTLECPPLLMLLNISGAVAKESNPYIQA